MIIRVHRILAALSLIAVLLPAPVGAEEPASIQGTVASADGAPIPGVTISLTTPAVPDYREETVSSKKGTFRVRIKNATVPYELRLSKEGFQDLLVQVQPTAGGTSSVDAVMVRLDALPPGSADGGPNPAAAAFQEGVDALKAKDLEGAVAKLQEAMGLAPEVAIVHSYLGQAYLEQGEYAAAAAAAERALELDPAEPRALFVRYQGYRALGDHERAEQALAGLKGSGEAAVSAKRIFNEGVAAYSAGDMATARARFLVATELDPALPEAYLALAEIYRLGGELEQSLAMADRVLELRPGDLPARRVRFQALLGLQRTDELKAALDELVTADPEWADSRLPELARAAFNDNLMLAALVLYEKVLERDPSNAEAIYTIGLCSFNLGDTTRAREAMTKFLELAPDDPDAPAARSMLEYLK